MPDGMFVPVLIAWAESQAEELGPKKCARKGVGGTLRKLQARLERGAPDIYEADTRRAVQLLQAHCRTCGKCRAP